MGPIPKGCRNLFLHVDASGKQNAVPGASQECIAHLLGMLLDIHRTLPTMKSVVRAQELPTQCKSSSIQAGGFFFNFGFNLILDFFATESFCRV